MTARDKARDFLKAQCKPLYRPVAGASVTVNPVFTTSGLSPLAPIAAPAGPFFSPYNWLSGGGVMAAVSAGAYVKLTFTGASLSVDIDAATLFAVGAAAADFPWVAVSIDGGAFVSQQVPSSAPGVTTKTLALAAGLAAGPHTCELVVEMIGESIDRWNADLRHALRVSAWHVAGGETFAGPATREARTVLLCGDSVDEAYHASTGNPTGLASASWVRALRSTLSAEIGVVAYAGQGYATFGLGNVPPVYQAFREYGGGVTRLVASLLSPLPDMIIVHEITEDTLPNDVTIFNSIQLTIEQMRAAAPGADIIMLGAFSAYRQAAFLFGVNQYKGVHPTDSHVFTALPGPGAVTTLAVGANTTDGAHPTPAGHATLAPYAINAISSLFNLGNPRDPNESDPILSGAFTPPTGTTQSALKTVVSSPSASVINTPFTPAYQGLIRGTVDVGTVTRSTAVLAHELQVALTFTPNGAPDGSDLYTFHGTITPGTPLNYKVTLYRYHTPYHQAMSSVNVDGAGNWSLDLADTDRNGFEPGSGIPFVYDVRLRLQLIATGAQIGAQWHFAQQSPADAAKFGLASPYTIAPFLYADTYYPMSGPAVADAPDFVDVLVAPVDLSPIINVVFTSLGGGSFSIAGEVSQFDAFGADNGLGVGAGPTHQVEAKYLGAVVGYFDVDGSLPHAWGPIVHLDDTFANWEFTLVRVSDSHRYAPSWVDVNNNVLARFTTDAFGFGNGGTEWRLRLMDTGTGLPVANEEWQASSGNVEYYDDLELRFCVVTDRDYWQTRQRASILQTWYWEHATGRRAIRLHLASDDDDPTHTMPAPQAEWTMSSGLPRSTNFLVTDTGYGTAKEGVVFTYDAALTLTALTGEAEWDDALGVALGIVALQYSDGPFPFAVQQRYVFVWDRYLPTGVQSWIVYALAFYKQNAPLAYQRASIDAAITRGLAWLESMRVDATGLLRGGNGSYTPDGMGGQIFDPSTIITYHATEHNLDAERAFRLGAALFGRAAYLRTAIIIQKQLIALHWNPAIGAFCQATDVSGVQDGASALDCASWGGILLERWGERPKAIQCNAHADASYQVVFSGVTGYRAFSEDDNVPGYSALDHEQSWSMILLKQRLGDASSVALAAGLESLQQADGGFHIVETPDPDLPVLESTSGTSWYLFTLHDLDGFGPWRETNTPGVEPATPRRLTRVEAWTDFPAAGGEFGAIVRDDTDLAITLSVDTEQTLTMSIPTSSDAFAVLIEGAAIVLRYDDGAGEPWRVINRTITRPAGVCDITAAHASMDLPELPLLREVSTSGAVTYQFGFVSRTPAEYIIDAVLPGCPPWVVLGFIDPSVALTLDFDHVTPYQAIQQIVNAVRQLRVSCEFQFRPIGDTALAIDLVSAIGESALLVTVVPSKHGAQLVETTDATPQTTAVTPFGKDKQTLARAAWTIVVVNGTQLKLTDPEAGVPPILVDGQLDGLWIVNPDDGALHEIVDSEALTGIVTIDDTTGFAFGDVIELRADAAGTDLQSLRLPGLRVKFGTVEDDTLSGVYNRIPNPFGNDWTGGVNAAPDGYTLENGVSLGYVSGDEPTIEQVAGAPYGAYGPYAAHISSVEPLVVTNDAHSSSFVSPLTPWILPPAGATVTLSVRLQINGIQTGVVPGDPTFTPFPLHVRVQLERASVSDDKFIPVAFVSSDATTPIGEPFEMNVSGIVLPSGDRYRVRLISEGPPSYYASGRLDIVWIGWQLNEGDVSTPFVSGSAANRIWHLGNYQLSRAGEAQRQFTMDTFEPARRDPASWMHMVYVLGGTVRLLGIVDDVLRVVQMRQRPRGPITTGMTFVRADDTTSRAPFTALIAASIASVS